jgi:hypothetical protein
MPVSTGTADVAGAEPGQTAAEGGHAQNEVLPQVEQPFQRDLRWRRQSFLPAKWDEVRQSERDGSFWNQRSRVVPSTPEEDLDQDKKAKSKPAYWSRNRNRD